MKIISRKLMLTLIVICVISGMLLLMPGALYANGGGWNVTFKVYDTVEANKLSGATVVFDSVSSTTDVNGESVYQLIADGPHNFTVSKTGFVTQTGSCTISGANIDIAIYLIPATYTVSFDSNGGTPRSAIGGLHYGDTLGLLFPQDPTNNYLFFWGWFTDESWITRFLSTTPVTGDMEVHALWNALPPPVTHPLNVVSNNSSWGTTTGTGTYPEESVVNINAIPISGYHFVSWGSSHPASLASLVSAATTFTMPYEAATVTANFAPDFPYPLTMGVDPLGGGIITGAGAYSAGTKVDITATPNYGYKFIGWEKLLGIGGDFDDAGSAITKFTMPASIASIKANFEWVGFSVSYDGNGNTNGSVPAGENFYQEGSTVPVLGNTGGLVKDGFNFAGWNSAADGTGLGFSIGTNFLMPYRSVVLYAQWTPVTPGPAVYTITKSVVGNGSITDPVPDVFNISSGASQTYTIVPGDGQSIVDVLVNGTSVGAVSSYTFTNVNSNQTIQAIFSGTVEVLGITNSEESREEAAPAVVEVKGIVTELPMTGQSMLPGIFGVILMLAGIMLGVIYRKKIAVK